MAAGQQDIMSQMAEDLDRKKPIVCDNEMTAMRQSYFTLFSGFPCVFKFSF